MSRGDKKTGKLKQLIGNILGINEWKLTKEGKLDVSTEELARITAQYGADFVQKFEKLLAEDNGSAESGEEIQNQESQSDTNKSESDMLKLELLCALLAIESITLSEDGNATLSREQLEAIEAGLKKLQDDNKTTADALAAANTDRDNAVSAVTAANQALDELGDTVKAADNINKKVEAVRVLLAAKPGAAASLAQTEGDRSVKKIEGADPATNYVQELT